MLHTTDNGIGFVLTPRCCGLTKDSLEGITYERSCGANGFLQQCHEDVTAYDLRKRLMIYYVLR